MQHAMALELKAKGIDTMPFIWFWPDGANSCAMMTHDVEAEPGRDFCETLMDLDDEHGIKAVVPARAREAAMSRPTRSR